MQTIIIATDLSPEAENATLYAVKAAQLAKSDVIIFHLFKISSHVANSRIGTRGIDEMARRMKNKLEDHAASLAAVYGLSVKAEMRMGDFLEEVERLVSDYKNAVLVLGMPSKTFEQDLLGNTTTAAIYKLKLPILAVPQAADFNGIRKILYACDLTRGVHATLLNQVKQYALLLQADVKVLYVGETIKYVEAEQQLERGFEGVNYSYKNVPSGAVIKAIQREAEAINADMLIMTPHKYGFWSSILHRSKTRAMASNGKIPLLSLAY